MEASNRQQISLLNQRGGRPLSIVDLIAANTVDLPLAAFLAGAVSSGASLLTAARPGNAGKTTLLAALLAFLPPDRRIVTVDDPRVLQQAAPGTCLLSHEIGSGHYYGYLWGADARRFFEAAGGGTSVASCIHADTIDELEGILCGPAIGLSREAFAGIDVVAFLRLDRMPDGYRRRVCAVYASGEEGAASHRRVFHWDERTDSFIREARPARWAEAEERARGLLRELQAEGVSGEW